MVCRRISVRNKLNNMKERQRKELNSEEGFGVIRNRYDDNNK